MADRLLSMMACLVMAFSALFTNLVAAQPSNDRVSPRKTVESSGKTDDRAGQTGDKAGKTGDQADKTGNNKDETEVLAWQLVETHLPELNIVLDRLRTGEPRQYQRAISDLARSAKKLEAFRKRDEQLFEIEVELVKTQHAVSLLTAKLKVRDNAADRKRLREAVEQLHQTQIQRAEYDVKLARGRLRRAEAQVRTAEQRLADQRENLKASRAKAYASALKKAGRQVASEETVAEPPRARKRPPAPSRKPNQP